MGNYPQVCLVNQASGPVVESQTGSGNKVSRDPYVYKLQSEKGDNNVYVLTAQQGGTLCGLRKQPEWLVLPGELEEEVAQRFSVSLPSL